MMKISSFAALNISQTLITLVDSIFRLIVVFSLIEILGNDCCNKILSISGALFMAPFLFFSTPAGHLADRFSKRNVIVCTLWGEVVCLLLGLWAISAHGVFSSYAALFLVALQASLFSPAKYSILPEIVPKQEISKANGHMTLGTYMAVIVGTFLASFIADITGRNYVLIAGFCVVLSIFALIFGYMIEKTKAQDPERKITFFFMRDIYNSLKEANRYPYLLLVCIAASYFLFTASYMQLNLIPFGIQSLKITDIQAGYIYLAAAFGIGVGSYIVTLLSKKGIQLWIAIWGAFGTAASYFLLYFFQYQLAPVVLLMISAGLHGGLYIVPLDAYIQVTSPQKTRGSIIAASTFLGVVAVLLAAGYLSLIGDFLALPAAVGFFVVSLITLFFSFYLFRSLPDRILD